MTERALARGITESAASALLLKRFDPSVDKVAAIALQGLWSRAFTFEARGRKYVVRFSAIRSDFDKDRLVAAWAPPQLRVPPIIDIGPAFAGFYAISEWAPGTALEDRDEAQMRVVLPSLLASLDVLRGIDVSSTSGYGIWEVETGGQHSNWRDFVSEPGETPRRTLISASPSGLGSFDECFAVMDDLAAACTEDRHLVHNDLIYRNVRVSDERISAMLDWGAALFGDFLYDIAVLSFWSAWYTRWSAIDIAGEVRAHYAKIGLDVPRFRERLRCYELHVGLSGQHFQISQQRYADAEWTARRTLELARAPLT